MWNVIKKFGIFVYLQHTCSKCEFGIVRVEKRRTVVAMDDTIHKTMQNFVRMCVCKYEIRSFVFVRPSYPSMSLQMNAFETCRAASFDEI